jgi:surface antigen
MLEKDALRRDGAGLLLALAIVGGGTAVRAQSAIELPPWAAPAARQQALADDDFVAPSAIVFPHRDAGTCRRELVGSLAGAAAVGAAAGTVMAGGIGRGMDDLDHRCVGEVLEHAPTGAPVSWRSPERGTVYRVTATRTYDIGAGRYCREYRTVATEAGGSEETSGAACRSLAGDWRAVE